MLIYNFVYIIYDEISSIICYIIRETIYIMIYNYILISINL